MDNRILVAYATKYGATLEIAEKIGEVVRQAGLSVDVMPIKSVSSLSDYSGVVLGSAVYIGRWRKEATKFLKGNSKVLAEKPVWLFSSGPSGKGDPVVLLDGWRLPRAIEPLADAIRPRDIALFHGALITEKMNRAEKFIIKRIKAPVGDFRDWDAITAWASGIAETLQKSGPVSGTPSD